MTIILGINAFHADSAAAIIKDGVVIAAAEEERFRRIKHWAGFPSESIKWCLSQAEININKLEHIAINTNPNANIFRKIFFTLKNRPDLNLIKEKIYNRKKRLSIKKLISQLYGNTKIDSELHFIEHHKSHIASSFYTSPFQDACNISIDGFGDFASTAWGYGEKGNIDIDNQIYFPHSLGIFYTTITQFLGFPQYGDEYKIMGLAPYGEPKYTYEMEQILKCKTNGKYELNLDFFRHSNEKIPYQWNNACPKVGVHYSKKIEDLLGPIRKKKENLNQKHMDIAHSAQLIYEKAFFNLVNHTYDLYGSEKLCLSGGCAANSVANGKITKNTKYKYIYIPSAPGDAGGAIGSALEVYRKLNKNKSNQKISAYLGPSFKEEDIENTLFREPIKTILQKEECSINKLNNYDLFEKTSSLISLGLVIGWFQGKMEWGPRALGNRSILGDPRRADMQSILNLKIKKRESFRPFAPSILKEYVKEWFEIDADVPYMMKVFPIKQEKRKLIPAVTHVDGSGRLQTVTEEVNTKYYELIKKFYEKTGVPMVLNTSFNENEPVVCSYKEALDCFIRTKMDVLVINNFLIERKHNLNK